MMPSMNTDIDPLAKYPMVEAQILMVRAPLGDVTTDQAIRDIKELFDRLGPYEYAKRFGLLRNGSGEDFAVEFMSFYNAQVCAGTY